MQIMDTKLDETSLMLTKILKTTIWFMSCLKSISQTTSKSFLVIGQAEVDVEKEAESLTRCLRRLKLP